jgi:hypothetical protein
VGLLNNCRGRQNQNHSNKANKEVSNMITLGFRM